MAKKRPAVREDADSIQIDMKKGRWPFMHAQDFGEGVLVFIDQNESGMVVGEGVGLAGIPMSYKKAARLRDFLDRVLETEGI